MKSSFLGNRLNDPGFWEEIWKEANKQTLSSRRRPQVAALAFWNAQASKLARWLAEEHTKKRVDYITNWLEQQKVFHPEMEVLDIGAGAGAFTIPIARQVKKVVALEPASAVMAVLREKITAAGLSNVDFLEKEWEKIDPQEDQLIKRFDLVFASLVPAIKDPEAISKMIACSRQWCFLCDFAGWRFTPARNDLWRTFFGEDMPPPGNNIIYPLLYLYFSGYCPSFTVWREEREEELTPEEAISGLKYFFHNYLEVTSEVTETITRYVTERASGGVFRDKYQARRGMLLWKTVPE